MLDSDALPRTRPLDPQHTNLVQWILAGRYNGDIPILMDAADPTRFITRRKAIVMVESLAGAFERGSTVCLHLNNDILYPILCLAIWASGCTWTGSNPAYKSSELRHHLEQSKSSYVVVAKEHLKTVYQAQKECGLPMSIICFSDLLATQPPNPNDGIDDSLPTTPCLHDLQHGVESTGMAGVSASISADAIATIMPTSGTTLGLPKLAARSHRAIVLESVAKADVHEHKDYVPCRLFCTPIFHTFSVPDMIVNSLRLGIPSYFMKRFDVELWPRVVEQFSVNEVLLSSAVIRILVNDCRSHTHIQHLRRVQVGGASFTPGLTARWNEIFSPRPPQIVQDYGMTEGGCFTTFKHPETDTTGSVGRPLPGVSVRVQRASRSTTTEHETGEIEVLSRHVMSHYLGDPEATREAFSADGWLKTGDLGYIDGGKVYIADRIKDIIKVNGFQVSPTELEDTLYAMEEHVKDVAVVAVERHEDEHPFAFIVRKQSGVSEEQIKTHLRQRLASYKASKVEVSFVDGIPRNSSGKVQRWKLREMASMLRANEDEAASHAA